MSLREFVLDRLFVNTFRLPILTMLLLGAGFWLLAYQAWLGFAVPKVPAVVLGPEIAPPGVTLQRPRTRLRLIVDGRRVECMDGALWPRIEFEPGATVPVLYYQNGRTTECTIDTFKRRWLLGALCLGGGFAVMSVLGKVFVRTHDTTALR